MRHPQIHLVMITNRLSQVRHRKREVVQQVLQNEVLMKEQQVHQIHRAFIQMKIHQVRLLMKIQPLI